MIYTSLSRASSQNTLVSFHDSFNDHIDIQQLYNSYILATQSYFNSNGISCRSMHSALHRCHDRTLTLPARDLPPLNCPPHVALPAEPGKAAQGGNGQVWIPSRPTRHLSVSRKPTKPPPNSLAYGYLSPGSLVSLKSLSRLY